MRANLAWWNLDDSGQTIEALREHLRDDVLEAWAQVPGLRLKLWLADRPGNRWGALMLWDGEQPPDHLLPANRAGQLIGRPPDTRLRFEVDAMAEGLTLEETDALVHHR